MHSARRIELLGCPVDRITSTVLLDEFALHIRERSRKCVVHFVNANKVAQCARSQEMRGILWRGDYVLADGQPLLPMARMLGESIPERIDGIGLMEKILARAHRDGFSVYLLGARQDILETCVAKIRERYAGIAIAGYRNGYFKEAEIPAIVDQINAARPDILFIGIGSPIKERFADQWANRLHPVVIQGVGGSFDVIAGLVRRAPVWMQRVGMEWLYRVIQEPRRMFWRYVTTNASCTWIFTKAFFRRWFLPRRNVAQAASHLP